jgi:hypothetical protein
MSTGLCRLAAGGRMAFSAAWLSAERSARRRPFISNASAAVTPGPPALVTTATRRPLGSGHQASARAQWNISSVVVARITPALAKAAS